ncbi:hypothetical protein D9M68_754020 [compost metagenome]
MSVAAVSIRVSPLLTELVLTDMFITSAPRRLPAISNEPWVRVEDSKNRLIWVLPESVGRDFRSCRDTGIMRSARSSRSMISCCLRSAIEIRWR